MATSERVSRIPSSSQVRGVGTSEAASDMLSLDPETKARLRIFVVDDERTLRESCASVLQGEGYNVTVCGRGAEALEIVMRQSFDIVLLDLFMSQVPGMELLQKCLENHPGTIVIMMTGNPSVASSIKALQAGAWDYLAKPFSATQLDILIGRAAHAVMVAQETRELRAQLERAHGHSEKVTLLGSAPAFQKAIELMRRVAPTNASVLVSGESGTGKELIAHFIHHHSRRSSRPLVPISCAALPEQLLESEMFGHRKGAFTGAIREKPGLLETANGGTLFLDELTEMSHAVQSKLLRVIQDGVVRRVGSETTDAVVNVRFISATNQDPEEAVEAGILRRDLYYRLRVVPVYLPPLRERRDDIPLLAKHFLSYYWSRHRESAAPVPTLTDAAIRALCAQPWRGNVRELENVMEHAVVLLKPDAEIQADDIPFMGEQRAAQEAVSYSSDIMEEGYHAARDRLVAEFERQYLKRLVNRAGGNMSKAARIAGVDRTTLYRLMEKHGLQRGTLTALVR